MERITTMGVNFETDFGGLLKPLTEQEIFDIAYKHALSMDKPSLMNRAYIKCAYFSEDTKGVNMCLIGAVVGEPVARKLADNTVSANTINKDAFRFCDTKLGIFLNDLQSCHDSPVSRNPHISNISFKKQMLKNLQVFAQRYELTIPDVQAS